jgi:cytochrome d ubiquinol oxidase subunit I
MDPVLLSRLQFAFTVGFHFLFPPISIGLSWLVVWIMRKYRKTQDELYRRMAHFWIKILALCFAVGVATGITMEFQFGTNWAQYSRFVGDIFGAPLAAEGILAFFLESSFLAVLLLGWNRVSPKVHYRAAWLVAIGATLSAFWIIVANSWQQTPAGFHLVNGRAELTSFWAAVFNPSTIPRFLHTVDASLITGAFFMMGIAAWFLLKKRHIPFAKESLRLSLIIGFVASVVQLGLGHAHGIQVAFTQPEKLAAFEGIFETQTRAPALLFGIPSKEDETLHLAVRLPGLLSLLAFGNMNAEVKGLKDFPKSDWPPLTLTFYPFHLMVALGVYFILLTAYGVFFLWKKKLWEQSLFLKLALWSIPLPFIANELGWITTEVGRQPWIVYHLLKTQDAVSPTVVAGNILFTILMFLVIYSLLFIAWLFLLRHEIRKGPEEESSTMAGKEVPA